MAIAIVLIVIVIAALAFHALSPWWLTPLASNWGLIDDTLTVTLLITGAVFVAVNLFIAVAVIRYRHRHGRRAAYEPENRKLEHGLTWLTAVGIVAMLAPGLVVYAELISPPKDALVVEVVGQQWQWAYRFPGEDGRLGTSAMRFVGADNPLGLNPADPAGRDDALAVGPELHLPLGRPVRVLLRSKDVLHNFFVPPIRTRMDMVPGMVTEFWFTPTRAGRFDILCAELCGVGHYNMRGVMVVEPQADFERWLAGLPRFAAVRQVAATPPGGGLAARGRGIAQARGCFGCHSVDGAASVGPGWRGLFGHEVELADGSRLKADAAYIAESIRAPAAKLVKGYPPIMPPYALDDGEVAAIAAYIASLDGAADGTR
ncbi:cytochrome c oxidase subunit II [Crenobacter luteus]|uniref:cytochrome-c oxidase n=1 Tax=Crenobacter luteus TaxID=1452487 RepID=A0A165G665_9NEIS|nr:cytochrome c oxidase subunit II [Crenobacter luteus]KZE35224.1 cytochrome B [Crenobacter luteus]